MQLGGGGEGGVGEPRRTYRKGGRCSVAVTKVVQFLPFEKSLSLECNIRVCEKFMYVVYVVVEFFPSYKSVF